MTIYIYIYRESKTVFNKEKHIIFYSLKGTQCCYRLCYALHINEITVKCVRKHIVKKGPIII